MGEHMPGVAIRLERACASLEAEVWLLRQQNAALLEALENTLQCFQGDWPSIMIAVPGPPPVTWLRGCVDADAHDAVIKARRAIALARPEEAQDATK